MGPYRGAIQAGVTIVFFTGAAVLLSSCATVPRPLPPGAATDIIYKSWPPASAPRQDVFHTIGPAETVYRISKMYDVPMEDILKANHILNPKDLRVGAKLLVPGAAALRPVIPIFGGRKWRYIVIHHSVTGSGDAHSLDIIHRRRGFERGLGYHFVIDNGTQARLDGQIEASPRWVKQIDGAHCNAGGMNEYGIGVCLVGDFTGIQPTSRQFDSLVLLVNTLRRYYHIPLNHVIRHKDVPGKRTECPGDSFPWNEFKERLKRDKI